MKNINDYFSKEKKIFLFGGSILIGLVLWFNSFLYFGQLDFFDAFPSHESTGLILILFGFCGIFIKMFKYSYPEWLKKKNNKKFIGKLITQIVTKKKNKLERK